MSIARLRKSKKPLLFSEFGEAHISVFHLQESRKPFGSLGSSNSEAPFRGRSRTVSTPPSRYSLEGSPNREEEPVNARNGPAISFIFLEIRKMSYIFTH